MHAALCQACTACCCHHHLHPDHASLAWMVTSTPTPVPPLQCGQYSELGVGARAVANDARRVGLAAVRQSRLARAANGQAMEALEPLHDELAMSPVGGVG